MKEVKLNNFLTSACLNLNYGTKKTETKNVKFIDGGIYQNLWPIALQV